MRNIPETMETLFHLAILIWSQQHQQLEISVKLEILKHLP